MQLLHWIRFFEERRDSDEDNDDDKVPTSRGAKEKVLTNKSPNGKKVLNC